VQLHEETIGFVEISRDSAAENMSSEEEELVQALVNRAALALENARLLEETSRRAGREHLVSQITTKIRSTNDPQEMIQTALDELKNALGATKVELARKSSD
jgi:GAF domain-containing protein